MFSYSSNNFAIGSKKLSVNISESVGNEVCPNTEHEKINSGTTGTENTHTEANDTTDDVDQA